MKLVLSPRHLPTRVFRRTPALTYFRTITRIRKQYRAGAATNTDCLEFDLFEATDEVIDSGMSSAPLTESAFVQVAHFVKWFSLDERLPVLAHRAQVPQGGLAKVAKIRLGLEAGVLRVTHGAVLMNRLTWPRGGGELSASGSDCENGDTCRRRSCPSRRRHG